jgi:hypothetical protein
MSWVHSLPHEQITSSEHQTRCLLLFALHSPNRMLGRCAASQIASGMAS